MPFHRLFARPQVEARLGAPQPPLPSPQLTLAQFLQDSASGTFNQVPASVADLPHQAYKLKRWSDSENRWQWTPSDKSELSQDTMPPILTYKPFDAECEAGAYSPDSMTPCQQCSKLQVSNNICVIKVLKFCMCAMNYIKV